VTLGYNDTAQTVPSTVPPFFVSMTFNGVAMTPSMQAPTHALSSSSRIIAEVFYINESGLPASSGTYPVAVTISTAVTGGAFGGCTSLFGVNQAAPEATTAEYNGGSTPAPSATLTTLTAGDWVIDALAGGYGSSGSASQNTGQTLLYNVQSAGGSKTTAGSNGGVIAASSYEQVATPGSVTVGWTASVARQAYAVVAFAPAATVNYSVSTSVSPSGAGTVALSPSLATYPSGTSVQVTATPAAGYAFSNFSGDLTGTTNPATLVVTKADSITANFTAVPCTLTITVVGQGTVTPASGSSYPCGTQVQITATPANGYSFGQFSGGLTGTTNPQTITLNANSSVTATFVQGTSCTLSTSTVGSGTISISPTGTVFSCGTPITVTATPATYYSLTGFSGAITGTTNPQTFTLNSNSTVTATFSQTRFPINTTIVGPGTVTANPADPGSGYTSGTQVTLTATPNSGAYFVGFSGAQTSSTSPITVTVNSTTNITATFANALITKDAVSHAVSSGSASTLSWQHTLGAGANRAIVIAVGEADSVASPDQYAVVTSVLFNGVYATPVPNSVIYGGTSGMVQTQLFYLLEPELPAAGTYTIQVNLAGSIAGISAGAVSLFGVNPGPPEAVATSKATTGVNLISTTITTLTNNAWVVDLVEDGDTAVLTANSGQTIAWQGEAKLGTGGSSTEAVPTAGAVTLGWSGTANRLTQSLAAFPPSTGATPVTTTLTTSVAGGVGGTVTSNPNLTTYPVSAGVLLTANPTVGYTFSSWSGDYSSTTNPLPITMDTNRNVVANFTTAATCTVNFTIVGSGSLNISSGTYNCGTVLQLQATPGAGYTFTDFSGDFSSTDNPAYFTLSANSNVTVEFDPIPTCTLTITTVGQGSVTPGTGTYTCGSVLSLQATAANGYVFSGFSGDFTSTANPASFELDQNTNITATFTVGTPCTLTTTVVGQGSITPSSGSYACGTTINIQANPASKYLFNGWSGDLSGTATPTTLTLNTNKNVTATFVVNTAGVTGDTRTVTEPAYPPVCTVLTAVQSVSAPVETSPDTTRVQAALNACPAGQAVEFSASADGTANAFLIQPITLPAGVTMLVDPEITILGSIKYADYACISAESWCTPLIDVAANTAPAPGSGIMGLGVIDGRGGTTLTDKGESWWKTGSDARPRLVFLSSHYNSTPADNFTMYKITLKNSPKFEFSGIGNNLTIWGVKIYAPPDSPNTDGIDPSGSQNITIANSYISDGDDMIAMKAGNGHVANVSIYNNHLYSGHGITVGSETNAGLNNMYVHDNAIDNGFGGSSVDSLRIKSDTSRGGEVYDVLYKNICINHGGDTIVIDPYYSSQSGSLIPNFHDITFSNVHELIRDSSHKSTMTGYNTNGIINPLTVTLDNVAFDGATSNDFKAPDNINNAQFTLGPGPVNIASFLVADAAVASNYITVTNSVSNSNASLDCSTAFVYLVGDLTAKKASVTAGGNATLTAVLQNVVSPLQAGTISYPQQNAPTGTINILEGTNVVGTGTITSGNRLTYITVPAVTAGTHVYTAQYSGDSHYAALSFGNFTLTANYPAPVANSQSVNVAYNTATPITLTATGSGTIAYTVATSPAHGQLSGTAPGLTYTPTSGYSGADSFTFTASNGNTSNIATVSITVAGTGSQSQSITFAAPASPVTYGAASITLGASATSGLAVTYGVSGPASLSGNQLSFTGQGTVTVTASQAGNGSYSAATPVQRTILVNPATLNIGVSGSPTRYFDQPNPAFTYTLGPFVNGDTQASATTGLPTLTTTATPMSAAGPYAITVGVGTLAASNYTFNPVNGQLTVTGGAAQAILFPALPNFTHTVSVPLVAVASSGLPVSFAVTAGNSYASINGTTLTITGSGPVSVTATQAGNGNFNAATPVTQNFTAQ
jgi:polygalacturonase